MIVYHVSHKILAPGEDRYDHWNRGIFESKNLAFKRAKEWHQAGLEILLKEECAVPGYPRDKRWRVPTEILAYETTTGEFIEEWQCRQTVSIETTIEDD